MEEVHILDKEVLNNTVVSQQNTYTKSVYIHNSTRCAKPNCLDILTENRSSELSVRTCSTYGIIGDWFINKDIGITHAWYVLEIVHIVLS